jgi:hypothetical protein
MIALSIFNTCMSNEIDIHTPALMIQLFKSLNPENLTLKDLRALAMFAISKVQ